MANLKNEYRSFLDDIEKNMKNKEDLLYVKERLNAFLDVIIEQMDDIMNFKKEEMDKLEQKQKEMEDKMKKMEEIMNNIERDIYSEDGFDFEIVCPYCNYEFVIDVDENKTEVECPECNNIIELDWSGDPDDEDGQDSGCSGHCGGCSGCGDEGVDNSDEDDDM